MITSHHRRGFSLVEGLVTIAVIAVLLGILLPAIAGVQHSARRAVCMSNLRQTGTLLQIYMDERSDGVLPAFGSGWNALHPDDRESAIGLWQLFGEIGGFDVPTPPLRVEPGHIGVCPSDPVNAQRYGYSYEYRAGFFMRGDRSARVEPSLAPRVTQQYKASSPGLQIVINDEMIITEIPSEPVFKIELYHRATPETSTHGNALFLDGHVDWDEINTTLDIPETRR